MGLTPPVGQRPRLNERRSRLLRPGDHLGTYSPIPPEPAHLPTKPLPNHTSCHALSPQKTATLVKFTSAPRHSRPSVHPSTSLHPGSIQPPHPRRGIHPQVAIPNHNAALDSGPRRTKTVLVCPLGRSRPRVSYRVQSPPQSLSGTMSRSQAHHPAPPCPPGTMVPPAERSPVPRTGSPGRRAPSPGRPSARARVDQAGGASWLSGQETHPPE